MNKDNRACDFCGYATRANTKCSDGRVIAKDAFKDNNGTNVPLVWQHMHDSPENVLGHAELENRDDGVYAYCHLNGTESSNNIRELISHGDITNMSIYANNLHQNGMYVVHGDIKEVSLVLSGANPGALIENVYFAHSDDSINEDLSEAIVYNPDEFVIEIDDTLEHSDSEFNIERVFNSLNDEQKNLLYFIIGEYNSQNKELKQSEDDMNFNKHENIFESNEQSSTKQTLSHSEIKEILSDAVKIGSLKESVIAHAEDYGIRDIEILFPDAKGPATPEFISRDTDWVQKVLNGVKHSPFSRIKTTLADITEDEARARGYVKGTLKKEEVFPVFRRVTTPTTIYKKQKLDRDDIIDITDFDVVSWLKAEMRTMLNEEIARCILVGDGRDIADESKINEDNIRPIYNDDEIYAKHCVVQNSTEPEELIETIIRAKVDYKGSGNPTFFTTDKTLIDMLLVKDQIGRRLYNSESELASAMGVKEIVTVPVLENVNRDGHGLIGIITNLSDYTIGADKGGQISMFDDFDIDFNQYKYLMETRCSGCLTKPKSALVIEYENFEGFARNY